MRYFLGDCRNTGLVEDIFGSVSEFARQIEKNGNTFEYGDIEVSYDEDNDIHSFWRNADE